MVLDVEDWGAEMAARLWLAERCMPRRRSLLSRVVDSQPDFG